MKTETNSAQHTPGPWTLSTVIKPEPDISGVVNIRSGDDIVLGACVRYGTSDEANARLMASAPDLLAALQAGVNKVEQLFLMRSGSPDTREFQSTETTLSVMRAAISKATSSTP